jgi:hypothetical protein
MGIGLVAVARRDSKTFVSVGAQADSPLSADAASALAGVLPMTTRRVEQERMKPW